MVRIERLYCLTLLIAALSVFGKAGAQDSYYIEDEKTFTGGFVGGLNFTQVDGDDFAGYHKVGFNFGGIVYAHLFDNISGSMEILYSQKGSKSAGAQQLSSGMVITTYGIKLNYAEVPIMLNYYLKKKSNFGAGLSYSRLASSSEYITTAPPQAYNLDQYPFKKGDLNFLIGGNIHIIKGLFLNLRFQYSLIPIRTSIPQTYSKAPQYNNLYTIRLMYLFF